MEKKKILLLKLIIILISFISGCFETSQNNTGSKIPPAMNTTIKGHINNIDLKNLEGVKITAYNTKYEWQNYTYTNISGYYQLDVFSGYFSVITEHKNYEKHEETYYLPENETIWINITLTPVGEDFVFTLLDGTKKHLRDYRGKVVIIDMWATWCSPCHAVMPELRKIYDYYSRDDLEIISLNVDLSESSQLIQSFKDWFTGYYGIELNWIFGQDDGSISEKYMNESAIPTLAVFDQVGRLQYRKAGVHVFKEIPAGFPENTPMLAPMLDELTS